MKQLSILEAIKEGERLRDKGIQIAMDHADAVSPSWSQMAYNVLLKFLDDHKGEFMTEQVRGYFALHDYELPPHARAYGGIIRRAALAGKIRQVRVDKTTNPKSHRANASVWIKV